LALLPLLAGALAVWASSLVPGWVPVLVWLLVALWLVIYLPARRYRSCGFQLGDDRLRVVRGVMFHADTVVPFSRVQHIDVEQDPLERGYGIARLILHTAGTHNSSVVLPGLALAEAGAMREAIRQHVRRESL
jgi:hypothetical protein